MSSSERSGMPPSPGKPAKEGESTAEESFLHPGADWSRHSNPPRSRVSPRNEPMKRVKEEPANLATWNVVHYRWFKILGKILAWNNRQRLKQIRASPEVLGTYHDSFLHGDVPMSVKARSLFRTGWIGGLWNSVEFFFALISGIIYVYATYNPVSRDHWTFRVQNVISFAFLADYIMRVYCEPVRFYFIFSFYGVVDLLSAIPVILVFRSSFSGENLLKLLQFLRLVRVFSVINKVGVFGSSVMQQITLLTLATCGAILLDAGILHWVEYHLATPAKKASCTIQGCLTFWESIYFIVVTIATVGYGDISPRTMIGQLVAMATIVVALTILPLQIGRITSLAYRRPYGGSFSTSKIVGSRFLIVSGTITFAAIQNFLAEFYNPTHCEDLDVYPLRIIILAPCSPSFEIKQLLHLYNGLVEFIEGSPVRQYDLERVSADKAAAFFLLADRDSDKSQEEDAAQIVRALAVHRFCNQAHRYQRTLRIVVEVLEPETQSSAIWDESITGGIEVICPVKVHYKMMARSCAIRGLYTLVTNLFTSEVQLKHMNRRHFLTEYFHSFDNEVYPAILPEAFHGKPFREVADVIFVNFSSILFAVDTVVGYGPNGQPHRKVVLFPKDHVVNSDDVGIIISSNLHTVYGVSTHRHDEGATGFLKRIWTQATASHKVQEQGTGEVAKDGLLLQRTSGRGPTAGEEPQQSMHSASYPTNPESGRALELQLRSSIQDMYSRTQQQQQQQQQSPNWGEPAQLDHQAEIGSSRGVESRAETKGADDPSPMDESPLPPRAVSLETAAAGLLAWPPASFADRPHPAAIEENEAAILKDLKERTIIVVNFNVPHILVCCQSGWPPHFFYFLRELRQPGLPKPPVVMLHPKDIGATQWGCVGAFEDVFFLKGSPLYELDLVRGGALHAEKILVLAARGTPVDLRGQDETMFLKRTPAAYTSDVENMVIAANMQRLLGHNHTDNVIVEMQQAEAFFYLRPQYEISRAHFPKKDYRRNQDALVHFGPPFMEGKAISGSLLGFLMRSSFYNRNTQALVEQLIQGGYTKAPGILRPERQNLLDQILVPKQYAHRPYSELFLGLLREWGVLSIGLYRVRGTLGAPTGYVVTNPRPDCIINPDDLLYVLS